jgi:hypothetical protein
MGFPLVVVYVWRKASVMLRPRVMPILFSRQVQPAYICLPSRLAARVGLAPTSLGLTGRRAPLTLPGNGAAGRISTCVGPFRRRMPRVLGHGGNLKLVSTAGFAPAIPRSQTECVGCYATRCLPQRTGKQSLGTWESQDRKPWQRPCGEN